MKGKKEALKELFEFLIGLKLPIPITQLNDINNF